MPLQVIQDDTVGSGIQVNLAGSDDVRVNQGITVWSNDATAIYGSGPGHIATILGRVIGGGEIAPAVQLGNNFADTNEKLVIAASGSVTGSIGVLLYGLNPVLINRGRIESVYEAVGFNGLTSGDGYDLENSGTIRAFKETAIEINGGISGNVHNTGLIKASTYAFFGDTGNDIVRNEGRMDGRVIMFAGNDVYDGRGGKVTGVVNGGGGFDRFVPGASAEMFDGSDDIDTLDFRKTNGVTVHLDGTGRNTGVARGDTYANIEVVLGAPRGTDRLFGGAAAEALYGGGGADRLHGGANGDELYGGAGRDTLTGGSDGDAFLYRTRAEGDDIITDFSSDDLFYLKGSSFGLTDAPDPSQFRTRADNHAQDANDRFIFRTTDRTLWFDANGKAAGGLTLIADLQGGAVVSANDIQIF